MRHKYLKAADETQHRIFTLLAELDVLTEDWPFACRNAFFDEVGEKVTIYRSGRNIDKAFARILEQIKTTPLDLEGGAK